MRPFADGPLVRAIQVQVAGHGCALAVRPEVRVELLYGGSPLWQNCSGHGHLVVSFLCILARMLVYNGSNALLILGFSYHSAAGEKQLPKNVEAEPPITP